MQLQPPIIGQVNYDAESAGESSTTSATFAAKVTLSLPSTLPAGRYRIGWSAEWSMDDENQGAKYRIQADNVTDLGLYNMAPKKRYSDTAGGGGEVRYYVMGGFAYIQLTAAAHTIDFDFASANGQIVYLRRARLEARRVGD